MSVESILETLRETVIDENKIVTYKTLSRLCYIHVNRAKQLLEEFLNSEEGLNSSYLLSGFLKDDTNDSQSSGYYVAVIPDSKLEDVKSKFKQLDSCHVYSIQKAPIKNSGTLYTDANELIPNGVTPNLVIKNSALINDRKPSTRSVPVASQKKEDVKSKPDPGKTNSTKTEVETAKPQNKTPESKTTVNGKGKKGNAIMSAFMKGQSNGNKSTPSTKKDVTIKNDVQKDSIGNGTKGSQYSSPKKNSPTNKDLKKAKKEMWGSESSSSDEDVVPPPKRVKTMNRIKQLPQSDSEEDEPEKNDITGSSQDSEDPLPSSVRKEHRISDDDDEDVIPPTPVENKTSRQYVSVKNTYLDEDGFLVTKKEQKLEEVELPQPPPSSINTSKTTNNTPTSTNNNNNNSTRGKSKKSKSSPDDKRKQTSMTSFFTKR